MKWQGTHDVCENGGVTKHWNKTRNQRGSERIERKFPELPPNRTHGKTKHSGSGRAQVQFSLLEN